MSQLKKEFKQKDVQRLRNLIQGKYGDKTTINSGYTKKVEERKEGDFWEEEGRTWTIKNSIKQNVSKLEYARKLNKLPLFCPKCNEVMKHKYDPEFYKINKHCYNCHLKFETDLKGQGKWEDYQKELHNSEIDNLIEQYKLWADDLSNTSNDNFISENGEKENWIGDTSETLLNQKEAIIKHLESLKK